MGLTKGYKSTLLIWNFVPTSQSDFILLHCTRWPHKACALRCQCVTLMGIHGYLLQARLLV